jgi:hypothetical protein
MNIPDYKQISMTSPHGLVINAHLSVTSPHGLVNDAHLSVTSPHGLVTDAQLSTIRLNRFVCPSANNRSEYS